MESTAVVTHDICPRKTRTGSRRPRRTSMTSTNTTRAAVGAGKLRTRRRAQSQASRTPEGVSPRGPLKPGRARCRVGRPGLAQFTVCSRHSYPGIGTVTGKGHRLGSLLRQVGTELELSASFVCRAR